MAQIILSDALWRRIESHLPGSLQGRRGPGRRPIPDRAALTGIIFVLKSGIPWEELPQEMGCGSGMTCLRRLRSWQRAGAWTAIKETLESALPSEAIDWRRADATVFSPRRPIMAASQRRAVATRTLAARKAASPARR